MNDAQFAALAAAVFAAPVMPKWMAALCCVIMFSYSVGRLVGV